MLVSSPLLPLACLLLAGVTGAVSSGATPSLRPLTLSKGPARLQAGNIGRSLGASNVVRLPLVAKKDSPQEQMVCLGLRGGGSDSLENNLAISFKEADSFDPAGGAVHTKFICTIGPITQSVESLTKLIEAGMNVMRMNFSHGDHEYHSQTIANVRESLKVTIHPHLPLWPYYGLTGGQCVGGRAGMGWRGLHASIEGWSFLLKANRKSGGCLDSHG